MFRERATPDDSASNREAYERHKANMAGRERAKSAAGREIGPLPAVADPDRRKQALESLEFFCLTYFPALFYIVISTMHRDYFARLERGVRRGERISDALPRGSGKTTIARVAILWAILSGLKKYGLLIGATNPDAQQNIEALKGFLAENDLLLEDFPEACFPIRALQNVTQRARGQTSNGKPTGLVYRKDVIVLATLPGSACAGAIIEVASMTGRIRGRNFKRPDGANARPDLAMVDDPQTKKSANSPLQCRNRLSVLKGDVLGLKGPGVKLTVILIGNVIRENDVMDQLINRDKNPSWHGRRVSMLISPPKNMPLWDEYRELRAEAFRADREPTDATDLYEANREAMDEGAAVSWPERLEPGEISGIQGAMNLLLDLGEEEFAAEYQQKPVRQESSERPDLKPKLIESKIVRSPTLNSGAVPLECDRLTAFIDVQDRVLFWMVCAWSTKFSGHIVDYGSHPEQDVNYYTARNAGRTMQKLHPGSGLEGAIYQGIQALAAQLAGRTFHREDGTELTLGKYVLVDEGDNGQTVQKAVREFSRRDWLMTAKGEGKGPADTPIAEYRQKPGEVVGDFWLCRPISATGQRRVLVDTNAAKTFAASRLETAIGDHGAVTIFNASISRHQMLIDHLTAETRVMQTARNRAKETWRNDNKQENHLWDCFVGNVVAASATGLRFSPVTPPIKPPADKSKPARQRVKPLKM